MHEFEMQWSITPMPRYRGYRRLASLSHLILMRPLDPNKLLWREALRLRVNHCMTIGAEQDQVLVAVDVLALADLAARAAQGLSNDVALLADYGMRVARCLWGSY
jgi:hypothetical protein